MADSGDSEEIQFPLMLSMRKVLCASWEVPQMPRLFQGILNQPFS